MTWLLGALALASACSSPTTLLVDARGVSSGGLSVSVFDLHRALVLDRALQPATLPNRLVVSGLPDVAERLRVVFDGQGGVALAGVAASSIAHRQAEVAVSLSSSTPDADGDGIPDAVDNCPSTPNHDQAAAAADGTGDACRGALADLGTPADLGAPPVLLGDDTFVAATADANPVGTAEAFQLTASDSGDVGSIGLYLTSATTATTVLVGIYSDGPTSLLWQATLHVRQPAASGWYSDSATSASASSTLVKDTKYWVGILGVDGTVAFVDAANGGPSVDDARTSLSSLPATWSAGSPSHNAPPSVYARRK